MKQPSVIIVPALSEEVIEEPIAVAQDEDTNRFIGDGSGITIMWDKGHPNYLAVKPVRKQSAQ